MKNFINWLINWLFQNPRVFNITRRILENNFISEGEVIQKELCSSNGRKRILDIGCGTGDFSYFLCCGNYTGVDTEKRYIKYAHKNCQGEYLLASACELPFQSNIFDIIFISHFFHHIDDEAIYKVLVEIKRIIKPDGVILIIEDVPVKSKINIFGKFFQKCDRGKNIREIEQYNELFGESFTLKKRYLIKSGIFEFAVFVLSLKHP